MPTLARQQATTGNKGSLARLTQLTTQLEASLDAIHGHGVISGGFVTRTGNFAVSVAIDTVLFAEGVALTLAGAAAYSSIPDHATVYLWGVITRTAADPTAPTALDTYALTVTHNTTGTAPSALHFLLATMDAAGGIGAQSDIDNNPLGKYLPIPRRVTLATEGVTIPAVDTWYIVTADFSAAGSFAHAAAFVAFPGIDGADVEAVELPSHKGAGVAAWRVLVPTAAGPAGDFDFSPVLYGQGFSGTDLTLLAATWDVQAAGNPVTQHQCVIIDPGAAGADLTDIAIFAAPATGLTLSKIGIVPQETPAGIDNANTCVVLVEDATGNAIVSKTYDTGTPAPAIRVYGSLGSLDATHKILTANEVVIISITQGATANIGSLVIVLEWVPA